VNSEWRTVKKGIPPFTIRRSPFAVRPFHWEIEFPEVFDRENPGFDAFVGNPPFAGKNNLLKGNREGYLGWLKTIHEKTHGNADWVHDKILSCGEKA